MKLRRLSTPVLVRRTAPQGASAILYVEDDDTNWDVARRGLQEHYEIVRARNAQEAIAAVSSRSFVLILMDIELAGSDLNGIELTQVLKGRRIARPLPSYALRVIPVDAPIVFVSAYQARYRKEELLAAGGDEFAPKPVDFTRLSLVMARLLVRDL